MELQQTEVLILDLDDTIFQTKSMDAAAFEPFFYHFRMLLNQGFGQQTTDQIIADLWVYTWDKIMVKHDIPESLMQDAIAFLDDLELSLNIRPYPDYDHLKKMSCRKFLVTTSVASIQRQKISALGIGNDFTKIIINDPFDSNHTKLDVFRELMTSYNLVPTTTFVIGDNPESEIDAGNILGMNTVQILRLGVTKGDNAHYHITSFEELPAILNTRWKKFTEKSASIRTNDL